MSIGKKIFIIIGAAVIIAMLTAGFAINDLLDGLPMWVQTAATTVVLFIVLLYFVTLAKWGFEKRRQSEIVKKPDEHSNQ